MSKPASPVTTPVVTETDLLAESTAELAAATTNYLAARRQLKAARQHYNDCANLCGLDR